MPIEVLMPALSPTMKEGNLVKWHKKEGDEVKAGDLLAEIETDKATMEVEAVDEGKLGKILVKEGTPNVKVNSPIAVVLEEGESMSDYKPSAQEAPKKEEKAEEKAEAKKEEAPKPAKEAERPAPKKDNRPQPLPQERHEPIPMAPGKGGGRRFASPLAKRLAEKKGMDLAVVAGSGPHGRIVKEDVENYHGGGGFVNITTPSNFYDEQASTMRQVIADRLLDSKQNVPHFYLTIECDIESLLSTRKQLNSIEGQKISVNDFVIRATGLALKKVPHANASWIDGTVRFYDAADVSVAVAIEGGLITPIVFSADKKPVSQISREVKDLAKRAKTGSLKPEEFQGGTFSVSNLGMFGIKEFSAIINPPQGCILAVGSGEERAVVREGELCISTMMNVTLSCDHRVVDGAVGAEFLKAFKHYIENPALMLV